MQTSYYLIRADVGQSTTRITLTSLGQDTPRLPINEDASVSLVSGTASKAVNELAETLFFRLLGQKQ
jgi:hypothetical protein